MILTVTMLKDAWFDEIEYNCGVIPQQPMRTIHIELTKEQEEKLKINGWHFGHVFFEPEKEEQCHM